MAQGPLKKFKFPTMSETKCIPQTGSHPQPKKLSDPGSEPVYTADQKSALDIMMGCFQAWGEGKFHKGHPEGPAVTEKFMHKDTVVKTTCKGITVPEHAPMFKIHSGQKASTAWWEYYNEVFAHSNFVPNITPGPPGSDIVFLEASYDTVCSVSGKSAKNLRDVNVIKMKEGKIIEFHMFFGQPDVMNDLLTPELTPKYTLDQNFAINTLHKLFGLWATGGLETTHPDFEKNLKETFAENLILDCTVFGDVPPEWKLYKGLNGAKEWFKYYEQFDHNKETMKVDFCPCAPGSNKVTMVTEFSTKHKVTGKEATGIQDVCMWGVNADGKVNSFRYFPGDIKKLTDITK